MRVKCNENMNKDIVNLLNFTREPIMMYAAQRILDLEKEVKFLAFALEVLLKKHKEDENRTSVEY